MLEFISPLLSNLISYFYKDIWAHIFKSDYSGSLDL
jgi:hypothetical protein